MIVLVWLASAAWQAYKPLPPGLGVQGPWRDAEEAVFFADRTFVDAAGARRSEQAIFDAAFAMIAQARRLVVLDMFLFNEFGGVALRPLSGELTDALLARKSEVPALRIIVVTDPINTVYGGLVAAHLERLRAAGVEIVLTDLGALRASNPLWSGPWALCCGWLGNRAEGGWLPNPFGPGQVSLRSWLALPNFRANHRKTLVVDAGDDWQALVTSANPHDASSAHGNVALAFRGAAALDIVASEAAVAAFSGRESHDLPSPPPALEPHGARLRVLTEGAIGRVLVQAIDAAQTGDDLDVAVFYLADRDVVAALLGAQARGAVVRVLLDPNEDAFGRKKNGVPNRQVARELVAAGVAVRWCDTHGEQCHAKLLLRRNAASANLIVGSANYTRRNLDDLNLETSVELAAPTDHAAIVEATRWFEEQWNNEAGRGYSVDYERHADDSLLRRAWYRVGEALGLSTW
ncbi:MAG: phospholipase D family protein [Xanthomonadales bacterium]|nr:phospholipase D family protein [Xanthomonadales bacterium]